MFKFFGKSLRNETVKKLLELRNTMVDQLKAVYRENESIALVNTLLYRVAGVDKTEIILHPEMTIDEGLMIELNQKFNELMNFKPVQYVTGKASFFDLELKVSPAVLIPRPETEELAKWIIDDNKSSEGLKILDIGTGSGCIILAIGKFLTDPILTAVDISEEALEMASHNANELHIPVFFDRFNILDENQWGRMGHYDIIVSNPPYVRESEKALMQPNVLNFEPSAALFVPDDDALVFYRVIARFARLHLEPGGTLYLEINENLGREMVELLQSEGFIKIALRKDLQGKDRMVVCKL